GLAMRGWINAVINGLDVPLFGEGDLKV
ncbi:MAG: hypothetical protein JWM04_591, partial [Verrucomicrobiales bacterium]|nr:hypothetical protein [Verrucomicrobiales bacterium]